MAVGRPSRTSRAGELPPSLAVGLHHPDAAGQVGRDQLILVGGLHGQEEDDPVVGRGEFRASTIAQVLDAEPAVDEVQALHATHGVCRRVRACVEDDLVAGVGPARRLAHRKPGLGLAGDQGRRAPLRIDQVEIRLDLGRGGPGRIRAELLHEMSHRDGRRSLARIGAPRCPGRRGCRRFLGKSLGPRG